MDDSIILPQSSPKEEPIVSLYTIAKTLRESKTSFSRVCYVAKLSSDDRGARLRDDTERWARSQGDEVTGLMLVVSNLCIHLFEGSSQKCFEVLKWNRSLSSNGPAPFVSLNVIAFTEENPTRCFGYWASKQLNVQGGEEGFGDVEIEEQSWDVYWKMCQIGPRISTVLGNRAPSGASLESALKSTAMDLVPLPEVLSVLSSPNFTSLDDFIDMYSKPPEITLDNEPVWPPPPEVEF